MGDIINISDLKDLKDLSVNIDNAQLDPHIKQAELFDIKPFLGAALYRAFITALALDSPTQIYLDLLNGVEYTYGTDTIKFEGLKYAVGYFALARYLPFANTASTKYGIKIKDSLNSTEPSTKQIQMQIDQARSAAQFYLNEANQFLTEKKTTYTLWKCDGLKRKGGANLSVVG